MIKFIETKYVVALYMRLFKKYEMSGENVLKFGEYLENFLQEDKCKVIVRYDYDELENDEKYQKMFAFCRGFIALNSNTNLEQLDDILKWLDTDSMIKIFKNKEKFVNDFKLKKNDNEELCY